MKNKGIWLWKLIVTGFGLGYTPRAPGTAGAAGAMIPAILLLHYSSCPNLWLGILIAVFGILGIVGAGKLEAEWGKDPSRIVIDEVVGMWIGILWIGSGWLPLLAAFVLFRFFDIVKPLGIRQAEQLPGGPGVMADDVMAGIFTNLLVQGGILLSGYMR